jgi:two-component system chemotaxis sensor kinase CheA
MEIDDELVTDFVVEANEHLAGVESQFLAIEEAGASVDVSLVNDVFRAIHSIKGAAGFLGLTKVQELSHSLENVLNMLRNRELTPDSAMVDVMLKAADKLQSMIGDVLNSNSADVSELVAKLEAIAAGQGAPRVAAPVAATVGAALVEASVDFSVGVAESSSCESVEEPSHPEPAHVAAEAPHVSVAKAQTSASTPEAATPSAGSTPADASIRVSVGLLDKLMNLAGELVLSRNQLLQSIGTQESAALEAIAARLDQVTSEVQESIMQTRMQQIGTVFSRFSRIVRDLSSKLGKECDLNVEGKEVEVDKTIIEAIGDPLTHLIRNSLDHGVETPADRIKSGKPPRGTLNLKAFYQAGKVRIEIEDDGAGIDPRKLREKAVSKGIITSEQAEQMSDREAVRLIFHPGFSMAAKITDVSGRGVGMDVVRTNIAKIGGTVDVESVVGAGTNVIITLPLTLAIIPSLIVQGGGDRFAIPQVNISELVRVRTQEMDKRLGRVKGAEVLRLRGALLPLVRLSDVLGTPSSQGSSCDASGESGEDRDATNIIVVESGTQRFGLIVDALHDSEEIVVKPLGRHIKNVPCLSGATILGDGHVALILDIAGVAEHEEIRSTEEDAAAATGAETVDSSQDTQSVLLFTNHEHEHFAVAMDVVARIERIRADQIDSVGGQELVQYGNASMPLLRLENIITARRPDPSPNVHVIVYEVVGKEVGLVAPRLEDIREAPTDVDVLTFQEPGVLGSLVLSNHTTRLVDLFNLAEKAHPEWFVDRPTIQQGEPGLAPLILLAEDSTFFRKQVKTMIEERGYRVVDCEDGLVAWEQLESGDIDVDLVVTDIEMPNMNGFQLCERIKTSPAHGTIPVIALTSLAGAADVQHGIAVGIDDYQIKMDRDKLLTAIHNFAGTRAGAHKPALQHA